MIIAVLIEVSIPAGGATISTAVSASIVATLAAAGTGMEEGVDKAAGRLTEVTARG